MKDRKRKLLSTGRVMMGLGLALLLGAGGLLAYTKENS